MSPPEDAHCARREALSVPADAACRGAMPREGGVSLELFPYGIRAFKRNSDRVDPMRELSSPDLLEASVGRLGIDTTDRNYAQHGSWWR